MVICMPGDMGGRSVLYGERILSLRAFVDVAARRNGCSSVSFYGCVSSFG